MEDTRFCKKKNKKKKHNGLMERIILLQRDWLNFQYIHKQTDHAIYVLTVQ